MKFLLRWTIAVIVTVSIIAFGGYVAMRHVILQEEVDHAKGGLNFLRSAIHTYAKDSMSTQRVPIFPQKIQDLIDDNYLNHADIRDCTHGMNVTYSPPSSNSPNSFIILQGTANDFTLYCPLSGEISQTKPKKL